MQVGLDRPLKLEWLDTLALKFRDENDVRALREFLHAYLTQERPNRESRRKNITVLLKIWVHLPKENCKMKDRALRMIAEAKAVDRICIHWGMTLMAYPFFRDIASVIGKSLSLQGEVSLPQIQRRMVELWGDRSTVNIATRKIVRMMAEWQVLEEASTRHYIQPERIVVSRELALWFVEALLRAANSQTVPFDSLNLIPCAFPFKIDVSVAGIAHSKTMELRRQASNTDLVALR